DALKLATDSKGKVVALSLKDRSAVLAAGKTSPDAVVWADKDGRFVTSTYYDHLPKWAATMNASGMAERWLNKEWRRSRPDVDYVKWAGFDDVVGEADIYSQGRAFPHPFKTGKKDGMRDYYAAVANSPMGNDLLLELTKRAIDAEGLGTRD